MNKIIYTLISAATLSLTCCTDDYTEDVKNESKNELKAAAAPTDASWSTWPVGRTITYSLRGADAIAAYSFKHACYNWMVYANVRFEEAPWSKADVRLDVEKWEIGKSYAKVGYSNQTYSHLPSGTLYTNGFTANGIFAKRENLHTVGHILGLLDGYQAPNFPYAYNEDYAIRDHYNTFCCDNWEQAKRLFMSRYKPVEYGIKVEYGPYDPYSVMTDKVPENYCYNKENIKLNYALSSQDKQFIAKLYPYADNRIPFFYGTDAKGTGIIGQFEHFDNTTTIEGVAGYVYKTQKPGTVPLYRYENATGRPKFSTKTVTGYDKKTIIAYVYDKPANGRSTIYAYTNRALSYRGCTVKDNLNGKIPLGISCYIEQY